jgi:hypothetical protein
METGSLAAVLRETWRSQIDAGFLLGDPRAPVETRHAVDPASGITFRFRWRPHRAVRGVAAELARLGIYDPECEQEDLPREGRDPEGRPCFLCARMIRSCFPKEVLVPVDAGGSAIVAARRPPTWERWRPSRRVETWSLMPLPSATPSNAPISPCSIGRPARELRRGLRDVEEEIE